MFRVGLEFFKFVPRRDERPEVWFQRFDMLLEQASQASDLGLPVTFQSWMLLSLPHLPSKKWFELLNVLHYGLPRERHEYIELQQTILRECVLEGSVLDLRQGARNVLGRRSCFTIDEGSELRPLYLCLGDPGGIGIVEPRAPEAELDGGDDSVDVRDGHGFVEDLDSDISSEEQWSWEDAGDLLPAERIRSLQGKIVVEKAELYWVMRRAIRRCRAAKGKFGLRRRFKGANFRRRSPRNGAAGPSWRKGP